MSSTLVQTFQDPLPYPVGIPYAIVTGVIVIHMGRHTWAKQERVLDGENCSGRAPANRNSA